MPDIASPFPRFASPSRELFRCSRLLAAAAFVLTAVGCAARTETPPPAATAPVSAIKQAATIVLQDPLNPDRHELRSHLRRAQTQLGDRFPATLHAEIPDHPDVLRWIASTLWDGTAPGGPEPDPALALSLVERAIPLVAWLHPLDDPEGYRIVALLKVAAILSDELGRRSQARGYKARLEAILSEYPILAGASPALCPEQHDRYERIPLP